VIVWLPSAFGEAERLRVHDMLDDDVVVIGHDSAATTMAEHVVGLVDRLPDAPVTLVGTSFGGWVAAEVASYYPERVARLVLVDAMGLYVPGHPAAELFALTLRQLADLLLHDRAAVDVRALPVFDRAADAMERHMRMIAAQEAMARLGWSPYLHDRDLPARLSRYRGPATIVWGDDDRVLDDAHAKAWVDLFDGRAEHYTVEGAGHLPQIEQPDRVAAALS
jgi:pimeloyl-ACP methyl ester carboxylesterase